MALRTTNLGIALIKTFESLALKAYLCPAGVLTIGYGHTSSAGAPAVVAGMKITEAQANSILSVDIDHFEDEVEAALGPAAAKLTTGQFDACVSLSFNIGIPSFKASTLLKRIKADKFDLVPAEFMKWDKATVKGKKVQEAGLVRRRRAECALWRGDVADAERYMGVKFPPMPQAVEPPPAPPATAKTPIGAGAVVLGVASAIGPAKEAISQAQDAVKQGKDFMDTFAGMAPWTVVLVLCVAVAFFIYQNRAKLIEHEGV
jgi:lysozyme